MIVATKYEVRGVGEHPSFITRTKVATFDDRVVDGNMFTTQVEDSTFIFVPTIVMRKVQDKDNEVSSRKPFFDPFSNRRRVLESTYEGTTSRKLFVFFFDSMRLDIFKLAEMEFDEFSDISKWSSMTVTYITKLAGNRLIFMVTFDGYKYFIMSTEVNSLKMKVVHKGEWRQRESIISIYGTGDYLYILTQSNIEIRRVLRSRLESILAASDSKNRIEDINKDFLEVKQIIEIPKYKSKDVIDMKVYKGFDLVSLIVLTYRDSISIFLSTTPRQ